MKKGFIYKVNRRFICKHHGSKPVPECLTCRIAQIENRKLEGKL